MTTINRSLINEIVSNLVQQFSETASERDKKGGTAKEQRDAIRQSGLLGLLTPQSSDGYEVNWRSILAITKRLAQVDSSIAHLFGYHFLCLATAELYGSSEQFQNYAKETATNALFWGNAFNPLDNRVKATKTDEGWELNGIKTFCSGATDSDVLLVSAHIKETNEVLIAIIPTKKTGIVIQDDWDSFGQRQTDSGSVLFEKVEVLAREVLRVYLQNNDDLKPTIRTHFAQSILNHVLLGTAEGAFETAKEYTQKHTRPWLTSNVERAIDDPYIVYHYGEFYVQLQAASALAEIANTHLLETWNNRDAVTLDQRGACSIAIATAKVQIAKTALEVTSRIFELMGARATSGKYNFDRYWRNVRTHTLHDPIDYKIRDIGQFALNHQYPQISPYS